MNDPLPPAEYIRQAAEGLSVAVREFGRFALDLGREQPLAHPTKADEE